jgi:hypothetical protein
MRRQRMQSGDGIYRVGKRLGIRLVVSGLFFTIPFSCVLTPPSRASQDTARESMRN